MEGHNSDAQKIEDDLAVVRGLMENSSRTIQDTGVHHVVWGGVIAAATLLANASPDSLTGGNPGMTWALAVGFGWILSVIVGWAEERRAPVTTGAGTVTRRVWIGVGISLTLLGFVGIPSGAVDPRAVSIVTAVLLAVGYFASSVGPGLRWFMGLAAAWWVGAVVLLLLPRDQVSTAFAILMLVIEVGAGMLLLGRSRMQGSSTASRPTQA